MWSFLLHLQILPSCAILIFAYDTYGKLISRTGTSKVIFGYNGRDGVVTEDNGLIYMRARYYSPEMKRFINADIVAGELSNAITLNRFAYANGNPVSFVDPFGLFVDWLKEKWQQTKDKWNTYVAEPVSKAWNTHVAKPVSKWWNESIVEPISNFKDKCFEKMAEFVIEYTPKIIIDAINYDKDNTDEQKVLDAHVFSSYKGKFVLKLPIGTHAFSFGIIVMGSDVNDVNDVKHEYGHTVQFDNMGFWNYIKYVAIPSVTAYHLDKDKDSELPYDYYTAPWEAEADAFGGVEREEYLLDEPWTPEDGYYNFWDLIVAVYNCYLGG